MRLLSSLLSAALMCAASLQPALAWGPVSHYVFACQSAFKYAPPSTPIQTLPLLQGADLPDGMWNGWFLSGTDCPPQANHMHSPVYAGYLILEATQNATYSSDPYFLSLAYGYATHNIADAVGFATQGGYLGNESAIIDWSTEWPFMLAVDAFLLASDPDTTCPFPASFPQTSIEQKGIDFLAYVNSVYNAASPSFPLLSADQIGACTNPWGAAVNQMNEIAQTQLPDATLQQLLFFDRFGAKNESDVANAIGLQLACIDAAHEEYFSAIFAQGATPLGAYQAAEKAIVQMYEAGDCTPLKKAEIALE